MWRDVLVATVILFVVTYRSSEACGSSIQIYGASIGPCVDHECPDGYMCINEVCVEGCYDTCYDCHCYLGYCNNPSMASCMQCCQASCGKCTPA